MDYKDFCAPFYCKENKSLSGLKGAWSQPEIGKFFIMHALGKKESEKYLNYSNDEYTKWFSGKRKVQCWGVISEIFDEVRFANELFLWVNVNSLDRMFEAFEINILKSQKPDKLAFVQALTEQFRLIAEGNGQTDNDINRSYRNALKPEEFPEYIDATINKFSKLKTLFYSNEEEPFYDFFVCNNISTEIPLWDDELEGEILDEDADKGLIEKVTLEELYKKSKCCIIVGMGGVGKSMMMRHLFLDSIDKLKDGKSDRIPIMVILREFGSESNDLFDLIVRSMNRFDSSIERGVVNKLLLQGKCQILLDGLDEIKSSDMDSFFAQLDLFNDRYVDCQVVVSSRRFSEFVGLSRYCRLWMKNFTLDQSLALIDNLKYYSEEPKLKINFKERLKNDLYKSHRAFATNPLLLTLMFMNYRIFTDIPAKRHKFYKQAYETLLQKHDGNKLTLTREYHSVKDASDFTDVFAEFCARSYRKGDYEFDDDRFKYYFDILHTTRKLDESLMKYENFKYDALHSSCLMFEEGDKCHFLHRSFQEYFFAEYYSRQDDTTLRKLGKSLSEFFWNEYDVNSAFDMLYELAAEKVERFIFIPYLEGIFNEVDNELSFWVFLKNGFKNIRYNILYEDILKKEYGNYSLYEGGGCINNSSSVVFLKISSLLNLSPRFRMEYHSCKGDYSEFIETYMFVAETETNDTYTNRLIFSCVPPSLYENKEQMKKIAKIDDYSLDEDGNPVVVGIDIRFDPMDIYNNSEKYTEMIDLLKRNTDAVNLYNEFKGYFETLKKRYENSYNLDDDDF